MHILSIGFILSSVFALTTASPSLRALTGCNVANVKIPLSSVNLTTPSGTLEFIANYSCNAAGTFSSIGAVAKLYDASCFVDLITNNIVGLEGALGDSPLLLGHHYFINNPTSAAGVSPVFDFKADSEKGNPNAFVVLSKTGDVPARVDPTFNIDWLSLTAIPGEGSLATTIDRITTLGGQPPKLCTPGSAPIAVPYAATYWFYK
ncbi:hypothetical protein M422DRAFT_249410 [Sphaerobolus stellatus SS14]|uniref:Unplaced genomic scaffold SPHSTscaffold_29, whole genome shotgun sequence n=1 Tax=Sphaerobolus stellatus (strain SS14) TaxID=990650 RepID=A0A0C9VIG4_SPHS4|nr:hypothetical protein M422DRAFT_249410 [Sphaerobolus stellatus SS14]